MSISSDLLAQWKQMTQAQQEMALRYLIAHDPEEFAQAIQFGIQD